MAALAGGDEISLYNFPIFRCNCLNIVRPMAIETDSGLDGKVLGLLADEVSGFAMEVLKVVFNHIGRHPIPAHKLVIAVAITTLCDGLQAITRGVSRLGVMSTMTIGAQSSLIADIGAMNAILELLVSVFMTNATHLAEVSTVFVYRVLGQVRVRENRGVFSDVDMTNSASNNPPVDGIPKSTVININSESSAIRKTY